MDTEEPIKRKETGGMRLDKYLDSIRILFA
jgi:hypothetical protein